ncbi:hypothetical protein [Pantoea vagans]|uniref:hypothetical protein n=1 Tax=Pantoea vagans TaxID=470934 RepID=UPI00076B888E|nr:hypothetical protein [Pantoea vagans]AMG56676.1 type III secretion system protein [Pantoea vagans]
MPLIEEDELEQQDSPLESLQQALNVLIPIRRQRLSRAQRQQRQQQTLLAEAEAQQQAEEKQLVQDQQHYQVQRERLQYHSSREKLTRHVNNALSALQTVDQQKKQCQQAQYRCQQAAYALEQATEWAREQQKAVEKLDYLSEHLEDA